MKILFTSHRFHPDLGGIEVNSEILARFFVARGHVVRLVTQTPADDGKGFPFPVIRRPSARELIRLQRWADVVYQNNIELGTLWLGLLIKRPTVISVRTWIRANDGRVRWVHRLKKAMLRRVEAFIAISEAIRRDSFDGAVVIGNPYRSDLFRGLPEMPRENSIAFLGRFVDHDHLLEGTGPLRRGYGRTEPIEIADNFWVGANAVIFRGVSIGQGAVVVKKIPPNETWSGVPAKKIGERTAA
jgi:hypothetical protein